MTRSFRIVLWMTLIALLIFAVLSGGKTLYFFLITSVLLWFAMKLILRHNERNLYILYYASEKAIHSGEAVNIDYKLTNTSAVPIFHAVIDFKLDKKLNTDASLKEIAYFGNYDKINFSKDIICKYRGYYKLGQVKVTLYDPLMLNSCVIDINKEIDITVYPKVVPVKQLMLNSQDLYGTLKSNVRTTEDRTNIVNIRPYQVGDQLKNIHWKLSAKKDALQTKEFEQTVSTKFVIVLDGSKDVTFDMDKEEMLVSFCASLSKGALDDGMKLKLLINNDDKTVVEGSSSADFQPLLETLTHFESDSEFELPGFLMRHLSEVRDNPNNTLFVLTQSLNERLLHELAEQGYVINLYTFLPSTPDQRELIAKYQSRTLKFHFIDHIMDVTYGK